MSQRKANGKRVRFAVSVIGIWVVLLDVVLGLMLLLRGVPRQVVFREGGFVATSVRWTPEDTAILTVLLLLQCFVIGLVGIVRDHRAQIKSRSME
jgi:hypothetical protein